MTFGNGHNDTLVLDIYSGPEEEDERMTGLSDSCAYIGHLAGDRDACVAMTGCPGSEDVEFTVLSPHTLGTSHMFRWKKDGSVEIVDRPAEDGFEEDDLIEDYDDEKNSSETVYDEDDYRLPEEEPPTTNDQDFGVDDLAVAYDDRDVPIMDRRQDFQNMVHRLKIVVNRITS